MVSMYMCTRCELTTVCFVVSVYSIPQALRVGSNARLVRDGKTKARPFGVVRNQWRTTNDQNGRVTGGTIETGGWQEKGWQEEGGCTTPQKRSKTTPVGTKGQSRRTCTTTGTTQKTCFQHQGQDQRTRPTVRERV